MSAQFSMQSPSGLVEACSKMPEAAFGRMYALTKLMSSATDDARLYAELMILRIAKSEDMSRETYLDAVDDVIQYLEWRAAGTRN